MARATIAGGEHLSRDDECGSVGPKIEEELTHAVQENKQCDRLAFNLVVSTRSQFLFTYFLKFLMFCILYFGKDTQLTR